MFIMTKNGWKRLWNVSAPKLEHVLTEADLALDGRTRSDFAAITSIRKGIAKHNADNQKVLDKIRARHDLEHI